MNRQQGLTLIELLIAIAIIGILSAIAIPAYQGYVQTAREGVLAQNIDTMRIFQENWRIENGSYQAFTWEPGDGNTAIGWLPDGDGSNVTYTVTTNAGPPPTYTVTATDADSGVSLTRTFP